MKMRTHKKHCAELYTAQKTKKLMKDEKPFILVLVANIIASNATRDHYGSKKSTQGGCKEASEESCSQGS